jgi:hypothetical protein
MLMAGAASTSSIKKSMEPGSMPLPPSTEPLQSAAPVRPTESPPISSPGAPAQNHSTPITNDRKLVSKVVGTGENENKQ